MNQNFRDAQNRNSETQEVDIDKLKRWLAIGISLILGGLSVKFSVGGFGSSVSKDDAWMGWTMAIIIVGIELIWNSMKDKTNLTLWVAGMLCYVYGIYTNITGFLFWQGNDFDKAWNAPHLWLFPIIIGIFLEIVPEPLFIWGLTGNHLGGDFLGNLFGNKGIPNPDHVKNKSGENNNLFNFGNKNKSNEEPDFRQPIKTNSKSNYQPKNSPRNSNHGPKESDLIPKSIFGPQSKNNGKPPTYHSTVRPENWRQEAEEPDWNN